MICSVPDCDNRARARGWCFKHYQRWQKHGDPMLGAKSETPICSIPDCDRKAVGRGWCWMHTRWRRNGDPIAVTNTRGWSIEERLQDGVSVDGSGCWLWTKSLDSTGYGHMRVGGRLRSTHVVAFETWKGPVPDGMTLDHECHNHDLTCPGGINCRHRRCLNPDHLVPRTNAENVRAAQQKLRPFE